MRTLTAGLVAALTMATAAVATAKTECNRACLTGFADTFEIHVHDGKDRVTMFMVLPEENDVRTYGSHNATTPSFVVREGDLEVTQTSGA